ncbi:hypothetical protein BP5796_07644 [Coleophoma crateriformis]|uniref:Uncharacterized protein n=1 Tax=Coleophoma crateriformis TaxID=565419 RepID=A0A3D8RJI7_9HELO|nr:hypothetical protein BP5796_07644 [Coleophoma crateriformis]
MATRPFFDLDFITQTGNAPNDEATQTRIRKHVMRDVGRLTRKDGSIRSLQWELIVPEILEHEPQSGLYEPADPTPAVGFSTASPISRDNALGRLFPSHVNNSQREQRVSIVDRLGAGRLDPFIKYPIEMTNQTYQLVDDFFDDRHGNLAPFRDTYVRPALAYVKVSNSLLPAMGTWFPVGLNDAAAFYQVLSNAALNVNNVRHNTTGAESVHSLKYHTKALILVRKRISDLGEATSDGLISTICGFACYKHGVGDHGAWKIHMKALEDLIRLRGGTETLNTNKYLRLLLFCNDLSGSAIDDVEPRFPLPLLFLPTQPVWSNTPVPFQLHRISVLWRLKYPERCKIMDLIEDIMRFSGYVANSAVQTFGRIYKDLEFSFQNLIPLVHRLLSISAMALDIEDDGSIIQEAVRLGYLLYIAGIKRIFGVIGIGSKAHPQKLCSLLKQINMNWEEFGLIRSWCLAMGAMEALGDDKMWFLESLEESLRYQGFETLEQGEQLLRNFGWYDEAHTHLYRHTIRWKPTDSTSGLDKAS